MSERGTDASAIFSALKYLLEAPTLGQAGAARFAVPRAQITPPIMAELTRLGLVKPLDEFEERVTQFEIVKANVAKATEELTDIERKLKTMEVRRRHAEEEVQRSRILKSKEAKWEDATRQRKIDQEYEQMIAKRHGLRVSLKDAQHGLKALIDEIETTPQWRHARWMAPTAIVLSRTLFFLYEELSELNPEHFVNRTLPEILNVGPLLG